jgi:hypothetical protein
MHSVDVLPLSVRAANLLAVHDVKVIGQLALLTPLQVRRWSGGPKQKTPFRIVREYDEVLAKYKLALGCRITVAVPVLTTRGRR